MQMLMSFVFLLLLAGLTGYFAKRRGRDPVGWFLLSLLVGVFSLLILFVLPNRAKDPAAELETDEDKLLYGRDTLEDGGVYTKEWYYLDLDHRQQGPISFDLLQDAWEDGKVTEKSYVWCEGMPRWIKLKDLGMLNDAIQGAESQKLLVNVK